MSKQKRKDRTNKKKMERKIQKAKNRYVPDPKDFVVKSAPEEAKEHSKTPLILLAIGAISILVMMVVIWLILQLRLLHS